MAVHDGERFLRESIDSILGQTFADFEFIIINDGSSDRTPEIVRSYDDPRIVFIENESNIGLAPSLNRGLGLARGEFVARQDDDDVSLPDRLALQVAFFEANPEVALTGSSYAEIDESGRLINEYPSCLEHTDILWSLLFFCPFVHTAVMFRRAAVLEDVGFYDPSYHYSMDFEYWCRIAARHRVANVPERLVLLRVHGTSMTSTYGERTREGHRLRIAAVGRLLGWDGVADAEKEARYSRLSGLLLGDWTDLDAGRLPDTVDDVLQLQQAFARERALSPAEAEAHRAAVRADIARSVFECGRALPLTAAVPWPLTVRLAWRAARLHGSAAAQPRNMVALTRLLARGLILVPTVRVAGSLRRLARHGR